jgi:hypothetical protein
MDYHTFPITNPTVISLERVRSVLIPALQQAVMIAAVNNQASRSLALSNGSGIAIATSRSAIKLGGASNCHGCTPISHLIYASLKAFHGPELALSQWAKRFGWRSFHQVTKSLKGSLSVVQPMQSISCSSASGKELAT